MLRKIWFRVNKFIFERKFDSPREEYSNALTEFEKFQQAQVDPFIAAGRETRPVNRAGRWKKPERRILKVNWDAAIDEELSKMGGAWRNSHQKF